MNKPTQPAFRRSDVVRAVIATQETALVVSVAGDRVEVRPPLNGKTHWNEAELTLIARNTQP